jgi:hypothetical protein
MIEDYSGPNGETVPQGKIILPPPQGPNSPPVDTQKRPVRPEQLVRQPASSLPRNPLARLAYLWRADPAYKVLIIAIGTILLSSIIGVVVATNLFAQSSPQSSPSQGQMAAAPTATPVPTGTDGNSDSCCAAYNGAYSSPNNRSDAKSERGPDLANCYYSQPGE